MDAAAQQLSACTWLIARFEPAPRDSDLCIGQVASSWQQVIRSSGVACHPAQTARLPAQSVSTAATAARRRESLTTDVGCWTRGPVSNRRDSNVMTGS